MPKPEHPEGPIWAATTARPAPFPSTHWSAVLAAGDSSSPLAAAALENLCRAYWPPLYVFARRSGQSPEDARDLTQGFFARLLEKNWLSAAEPERGRFRTFLLTAFKRFMADEFDRARAQKRGGGQRFVPMELDAEESRLAFEPADERTPEVVYEERWAAALLERVLGRLREEFQLQGRAGLFDTLKGFLLGDPPDQGWREVAAGLSMNEGAARMVVSRMRQRYRQLVRSELAQTVSHPGEIEDELRHLYRVLSGGS